MGRPGPGKAVVRPGKSVPELEPEAQSPATCPDPSPAHPHAASGWELLESPQNPSFAVCLFSILNIENGQPVKLNNLDLLSLMLSLVGGEKRWVCQQGWQLSKGYTSTFCISVEEPSLPITEEQRSASWVSIRILSPTF